MKYMSLNNFRFFVLALALAGLMFCRFPAAAQDHGGAHDSSAATQATEAVEEATGNDVGPHGGAVETGKHADTEGHAAGDHGEKHEPPGPFDPHAGTWLHPISRLIFGEPPVGVIGHGDEKHFTNIKNDFIVVALFLMLCLGVLGVLGARGMKLRPEGKPMGLSNIVETVVEGYHNYLVGVMGPALAAKYSPLVSSFFFTILLFNWIGLVPGMLAPTANPNIPVSLAIVAFFSVHFIAIKEAGIKSWFMHMVGEPLWLAPLNFPLHLIGEIIKPISLAVRLLGNIFGEEMVVLYLSILGIGILSFFPIPLQFPILCMGILFGLLQALVFSTLLAIYISILTTHHDDHDEHNEHGHVEHIRDANGHRQIIAHPSETTIA